MAKSGESRFLFISDLQIPFEVSGALRFCQAVIKEFKIPPFHLFNVGDELDIFHGSTHPKDGDFSLTPVGELKLARERLREWYKAFPKMHLAISNHGLRWARKAAHAQIPSEVLRTYKELIHAPEGWKWKDRWDINAGRARISMIHGMGYSGMHGHRKAAIDLGTNVVIGHLHSHAGVAHIGTDGRQIWGMNVGCLIDKEAFAFQYGKWMAQKPILSVGVVIDGGLTPILIPYERF